MNLMRSNNGILAAQPLPATSADIAIPRRAEPKAKGKTASKEFNPTVHGLRGVAAMMVFLAHILGGVGENVYPNVQSYLSLTHGPANFGRWGVWLFFVISGYVILPSVLRYTPREFALRRFFRLYPLFFAFSLLFITINALTNAFPDLNSIHTIISALLMINLLTETQQLTPNAWSLSYEVLFYAMACAMVHVAVRRRHLLGTALLIAVAAWIVSRYPAMAFFLAGIGARLLEDASIRPSLLVRQGLEILTLSGCVYLASAEHYNYLAKDLGDWRSYALYVCTAVYFYMAISPGSLTTPILKNPSFFYLGTVSYSLYIAHPYTYVILRKVFTHFGLFIDNWLASIAVFIALTVPVTLAFTHVVYRLLERYPYHWYFHERVFHR